MLCLWQFCLEVAVHSMVDVLNASDAWNQQLSRLSNYKHREKPFFFKQSLSGISSIWKPLPPLAVFWTPVPSHERDAPALTAPTHIWHHSQYPLRSVWNTTVRFMIFIIPTTSLFIIFNTCRYASSLPGIFSYSYTRCSRSMALPTTFTSLHKRILLACSNTISCIVELMLEICCSLLCKGCVLLFSNPKFYYFKLKHFKTSILIINKMSGRDGRMVSASDSQPQYRGFESRQKPVGSSKPSRVGCGWRQWCLGSLSRKWVAGYRQRWHLYLDYQWRLEACERVYTPRGVKHVTDWTGLTGVIICTANNMYSALS